MISQVLAVSASEDFWNLLSPGPSPRRICSYLGWCRSGVGKSWKCPIPSRHSPRNRKKTLWNRSLVHCSLSLKVSVVAVPTEIELIIIIKVVIKNSLHLLGAYYLLLGAILSTMMWFNLQENNCEADSIIISFYTWANQGLEKQLYHFNCKWKTANIYWVLSIDETLFWTC